MSGQQVASGQTEDRLSQLLHTLHDAVIFVRRSDRVVLDANPAALRLFGFPREELIGRPTTILHLDREHWEAFAAHARPAMTGESTALFEFDFRRKDGSIFPAHITISPAGLEGDAVVGILRDLTAVKAQRRIEGRKQASDAFLNEASTLLLHQTLHPEEALRTVAELATSSLSDHAAVDIIELATGNIRRVVLAHADPAKAELVDEYMRRFPPQPSLSKALRALPPGGVILRNDISRDLVLKYADRPGEIDLIDQLGHKHSLVVPLASRGVVTGGISLARASGMPFDEEDVQLAKELAARASLAYENALLHRDTTFLESRWRSLVEHADDWIYLADREGKILQSNRARPFPHGRTLENSHFHGWLDATEVAKFKSRYEGVFDTGKAATISATLGVSGARAHYECRVSPVMDGEHVTLATVTVTDVTQRVERVAELHELAHRERDQSRKLETLLRAQHEIARNLDLERLVQAATDAATTLSGASFGAFFYNVIDAHGERFTLYTLSGAPREAFSKFPMPRNTQIFAPTFSGDEIVRSDDITKDPRYGKNAPYSGMPKGHLPVRSYLAVPVIARDGSVHGGFFLGHPAIGVFNAESEAVVSALAAQASIALDNAHLYRRAKTSEERLQRILQTAPVQVITIDAAGKILSLNRSVRGSDPGELLGQNMFEMILPEDREIARASILRTIETGEPSEYEARALVGPGDIRWYNIRVGPLPIEDHPTGAILVSTDIGERKAIQAEIDMLRAQLIQGEKLAALGSLVSGVAHELRTPLTFLANNAFLLQTRLEREARQDAGAKRALDAVKPYLSDILGGVDRINLLVEDLRKYTKARQDKARIVAPLQSLLTEAIELFTATSRGSHVIQTSLSSTRPVRANKGALQQLVLNLVMNAAEASPAGTTIRISTKDIDGAPAIEVTDHGPGIPADVVDRMYDPLFTTKEEGTGLGLSIVKRIVDDHDARIECDTAEGQGTTFRVIFPAA